MLYTRYTGKQKPKRHLNWGRLLLVFVVLLLLILGVVWACGGFSGDRTETETPKATKAPKAAATDALKPTATEATVPTDEPEPTAEKLTGQQAVSLNFVGDILLDGNTSSAARNKNDYDFTAFFERITPYTEKADFTLGTMEAPIAEGKVKDLPKANAPLAFAKGIQNAGVDLVNLATNHLLDQGAEGVAQTEKALTDIGLLSAGTPATQGSMLTKDKLQIAVLGYTTDSEQEKETFAQNVKALTQENVLADVQAAYAAGARVLVAMVHWGTEDAKEVTPEMEAQAKMLADAGVDIIIGGNVRCVLPAKMLQGLGADGQEKECLVVYSLGSFLTNSLRAPHDTSALLQLELNYDYEQEKLTFVNKTYLPTWTLRYSTNGKYHFEVLAASEWQERKHDGIGPEQRARVKVAHKEVVNVLGEEVLKPVVAEAQP